MGNWTDSITTFLTGGYYAVLIIALITTPLISWGLLQLYRRAVIKTMQSHATREKATEGSHEERRTVSPPKYQITLRLRDHLEIPERIAREQICQKTLLRSPWKTTLVYALAGIGFALVFSLGYMISGDISFLPLRTFTLVLVFGWPVLLMMQITIGTTRRNKVLPIIIYFGALVFLSLLLLVTSPTSIIGGPILLWFSINALPTIAWIVVLNRRIRAVGALVLTFIVFAITGALVMFLAIGNIDVLLDLLSTIFVMLGASSLLLTLFTIGFGLVIFGILGWLILHFVRIQYERRNISDQSLLLDSLWLLFMTIYAVSLIFEGIAWVFVGPLAFLVYKFMVILGYKWITKQTDKLPKTLLLLRVFSLGKRSEQLFDAVSTHWRYLGNIQLISGPDLATTTIEPHEFLDFVSGRLSRHFIDSQVTLNMATSKGDEEPDRDGRYRVREFFCYDDTWKMVLTHLAKTSGSVLMDLRGFSPQNAGCIFEINELIRVVPLNQLVFVIDSTTNTDFLTSTIKDSWQGITPKSPNYALSNPILRLFRYDDKKHLALTRLLETLCEATNLPAI
jgi:hypothetical protein